jgi:DNA-binding response OmpR family regulator
MNNPWNEICLIFGRFVIVLKEILDMKSQQILIVDDDPAIRKFVRANLEARDYRVILAVDGEEALKLLETESPNLILLDIMMPKMNGFEVCQRVREWSNTPIIMLSAREGESDKVRCLDCGADDYLTKPFSLKELLSRVNAVLRRSQDNGNLLAVPKYHHDDLEVDLALNMVRLKGLEVNLTGTEFKILSYLVINAGRLITPDQILGKVWGEDYIGDNHLIQVNMARLRKRLNDSGHLPKYIETRSGIGYMIKMAN